MIERIVTLDDFRTFIESECGDWIADFDLDTSAAPDVVLCTVTPKSNCEWSDNMIRGKLAEMIRGRFLPYIDVEFKVDRPKIDIHGTCEACRKFFVDCECQGVSK